MKIPVRTLFTHLATFGLALGAAAWFSASRNDAGISGKETAGGAATASPVDPRPPDRPGRPATRKRDAAASRNVADPSLASKDYRAAWEAIAFRDVTIQERVDLQRELLRQWAEVDLEAALKAALSCAWDGDGGMGGIDQLLDSFEDAFAARPLEAWDLLLSGRPGLGTSIIKARWAAVVARREPMLVLSHLNDLPARSHGSTLKTITAAVAGNPELRDEFFDRCCTLPQTRQFSTWMSEIVRTLGPSGTPSEIGRKLAEATTDQQRTRYIHEFGISLKSADPSTIVAEWNQLPAGLRGRASNSLYLHADPTSDIPALTGLLIQANEWKSLAEQSGKISEHGYKTGKVEPLANWTATLPDRPESRLLLSRSLEPFIVNHPTDAKQWIDRLPGGDWRRDEALAEFSRHSLWRMNDRDNSTWAIDHISNPQIRESVINVRAAWARQKGVDP